MRIVVEDVGPLPYPEGLRPKRGERGSFERPWDGTESEVPDFGKSWNVGVGGGGIPT